MSVVCHWRGIVYNYNFARVSGVENSSPKKRVRGDNWGKMWDMDFINV